MCPYPVGLLVPACLDAVVLVNPVVAMFVAFMWRGVRWQWLRVGGGRR